MKSKLVTLSRYVLQKACINEQATPPDFVSLHEKISQKLSGRIGQDDLEGYVAEKFGFLEGKPLTRQFLNGSHPNLARRHNSPCRWVNAGSAVTLQ